MKCLVLGVKAYDFTNDNGEKVKGSKVYYVTSYKTEGIEGNPPMIVNVDDSSSIKILPAIYDLDFTMKPGKNNKPEIVLNGVEFVSPVNVVTSDGEVYISSND